MIALILTPGTIKDVIIQRSPSRSDTVLQSLVPRQTVIARKVTSMSDSVCLLKLGQAAHSSNRRMISMNLHPNRMREPHNMKGTP